MKFEYGTNESLSNLNKHGISFEEARRLWFGIRLVIAFRSNREKRFMAVGKIGSEFYSCLYTFCNDYICIISAVKGLIMHDVKDQDTIDADELDKKFNNKEDVTPYLNIESSRMEHVNVNTNIVMTKDMTDRMDQLAKVTGIPIAAFLEILVHEDTHRTP